MEYQFNREQEPPTPWQHIGYLNNQQLQYLPLPLPKTTQSHYTINPPGHQSSIQHPQIQPGYSPTTTEPNGDTYGPSYQYWPSNYRSQTCNTTMTRPYPNLLTHNQPTDQNFSEQSYTYNTDNYQNNLLQENMNNGNPNTHSYPPNLEPHQDTPQQQNKDIITQEPFNPYKNKEIQNTYINQMNNKSRNITQTIKIHNDTNGRQTLHNSKQPNPEDTDTPPTQIQLKLKPSNTEETESNPELATNSFRPMPHAASPFKLNPNNPHLDSADSPKPLKCPLCPVAFYSHNGIIDHISSHKQYICFKCNKTFRRKHALIAHLKNLHSPTNQLKLRLHRTITSFSNSMLKESNLTTSYRLIIKAYLNPDKLQEQTWDKLNPSEYTIEITPEYLEKQNQKLKKKGRPKTERKIITRSKAKIILEPTSL